MTVLHYSWFAKPMPHSAGKSISCQSISLFTAWAVIAAQPTWHQEEWFRRFGWQKGPITVLLWATLTQMISQFWDLSAVAITARLSFETEGMLFRYPSLPFVETPLVLFVFPVLFGPVYSWHKRLLLTPLHINGDQCWAEGKLKYEEVETSGQ